MVTGLWTAFLLSLACASAIAWLAALMRERGLRPVRELAAFLKRHSVFGRVILSAFFIGMCVYGSTKSGNGGGGDDGGAKQGGMGCGDGAPAVAGGGLSLFFFDPHGLPRLFADPLDITIWAFTRFALRCGTIGNI